MKLHHAERECKTANECAFACIDCVLHIFQSVSETNEVCYIFDLFLLYIFFGNISYFLSFFLLVSFRFAFYRLPQCACSSFNRFELDCIHAANKINENDAISMAICVRIMYDLV